MKCKALWNVRKENISRRCRGRGWRGLRPPTQPSSVCPSQSMHWVLVTSQPECHPVCPCQWAQLEEGKPTLCLLPVLIARGWQPSVPLTSRSQRDSHHGQSGQRRGNGRFICINVLWGKLCCKHWLTDSTFPRKMSPMLWVLVKAPRFLTLHLSGVCTAALGKLLLSPALISSSTKWGLEFSSHFLHICFFLLFVTGMKSIFLYNYFFIWYLGICLFIFLVEKDKGRRTHHQGLVCTP